MQNIKDLSDYKQYTVWLQTNKQQKGIGNCKNVLVTTSMQADTS